MGSPTKKNGRGESGSGQQSNVRRLPGKPRQPVHNAIPAPRRGTPRTLALTQEQEEIWEKAAAFCVRHLPTLWTAGEPRRQSRQGWVVPIILRYPDGYEGILGEMAWDGLRQAFTLLTERTILSERARRVAASRP
jgi:hypothetical protein